MPTIVGHVGDVPRSAEDQSEEADRPRERMSGQAVVMKMVLLLDVGNDSCLIIK